MTQPLIAVTMGDPAGIGPEIIARTFDEGGFQNRAIVVGDAGILERAARLLDLALRANVVAEPEDARFEPGTVDVISETELPGDLPFDPRLSQGSYRAGQARTRVGRHPSRPRVAEKARRREPEGGRRRPEPPRRGERTLRYRGRRADSAGRGRRR